MIGSTKMHLNTRFKPNLPIFGILKPNIIKSEWALTRQTYLEIFHGVLQRFNAVAIVRSLYGAGIAEEQALIHAVVPEHLIMFQTLPLPHVIERLHQRVFSESRELQMRLNMLWAHGHFTLQAGFNCHETFPISTAIHWTVITVYLSTSVRWVTPALSGSN